MPLSDFRVMSTRGDRDLRCVAWRADFPRAVLQISHGMIEHIDRYAPLAEYLNGHGVLVYGHDHLGHGMTSPDDRGFIADRDGDEVLVDDLHVVTIRVREENPGVPLFVLGHSMGSFVLRRYITRYGGDIDGAIIMGTGNQSSASVATGKAVASLLISARGPRSYSGFLDRAVLTGNDRHFTDSDRRNRWLSRDQGNVDRYNADPMTSFRFTVSAYRDLFSLIQKDIRLTDGAGIPKDLPILIMSGTDDPIGGFGKGVEKTAEGLRSLGLHPEVRLYDGRHEILNDTCAPEIMDDLLDWMLERVGGPGTRTRRSSGRAPRSTGSDGPPSSRPTRSNSPR